MHEDAEEIDTPLLSLSIRGRQLCNLRFADHIDLLGGSEEKLQQLTERLEKNSYWIQLRQSKILINSIKPRLSTHCVDSLH